MEFKRQLNATELMYQNFVGQEVLVNKIGEFHCILADNDITINKIRESIAVNGHALRMWLPGTIGTADLRYGRINVYVEEVDGKFLVTEVSEG